MRSKVLINNVYDVAYFCGLINCTITEDVWNEIRLDSIYYFLTYFSLNKSFLWNVVHICACSCDSEAFRKEAYICFKTLIVLLLVTNVNSSALNGR
jgi:hypothetical protein